MNIIKTFPAVILVASAFSVQAQNVEKLHISGIEAGKDGDRFNVSMKVSPRDYRLSLNREIEIVPVIWSEDSTQSLELPSITIAGKNMYHYDIRNGRPSTSDAVYRSGKGETVEYNQSVDYEPWMDKSTFGFLRRERGCCGSPKGEETVPVAEIDYTPEVFAPQFVYTRPKAQGEKIINLEGQAYIDFPVNRTEIYPDYRKNPLELQKILKTIDAVKGNSDATVKQISLKGFASPEGPYNNNVRLAKGRTQALKEYVGKQYDFAQSVYKTSFEPEDWEGLVDSLKVSVLPAREEILALIAQDIEPDRKDALIKKRFPSDYAYILKYIYPALRHTNYVITYSVRKYTDVNEIKRVMAERPNELSLEEFYLLAQSYPAGSKEFDEVFDIAVRMFPNDPVANLNAANAAMASGHLDSAEKYLAKSGDSADADYARGLCKALRNDYDGAAALLEKAGAQGMPQARNAIDAVKEAKRGKTPVTFISQ